MSDSTPPENPDDSLLILHTGSPVRPPDWRVRRASRLHRMRRAYIGVPRASVGDDLVVQLLVLQHGWEWEPPRPEELPAIEAALRWHAAASPHDRFAVEVRLLAGESDSAIAARVGLPPEVIHFHERLHYHCRDRLHVRSFIINTFLASDTLAPSRALVLRRLAYFHGMAFLETLLDALADAPPVPSEESETRVEWEAAIDRAELRRWFALQQLSPIHRARNAKELALLESVQGPRPRYRYGPAPVAIPLHARPAAEPVITSPVATPGDPVEMANGQFRAA